jgi:hypothetical protein
MPGNPADIRKLRNNFPCAQTSARRFQPGARDGGRNTTITPLTKEDD